MATLVLQDAHPSSVTAQSTAILNLDPQITVQPAADIINVNYSGLGLIEVTAEFFVEANTAQVNMFVEATNFYFWGDSDPLEIAIPLNQSAGVEINPQDATPIGGASTTAHYTGAGGDIEGFPSQKTETISFQSSEQYSFIHTVSVTVSWNHDDPQKPAGEYAAKIKLTCFTLPNGS